jgi:hypothetical protein
VLEEYEHVEIRATWALGLGRKEWSVDEELMISIKEEMDA